MKLSVVLFVVFVASICAGDDQEKAMQEMEKKCLAESKISLEAAHTCLKENKDTGECAKIGCVHACMFQVQGLMNKDGTMKTELIAKLVKGLKDHGHPKTSAAVEKCMVNHKKKTACDCARAIDACMSKMPHD